MFDILKGKVKSETSDRDYVFPCVNETKSGINFLVWLKMLRAAHNMAGRHGGPAITSWKEKILTSAHLDGMLHYHLIEMLENNEEFPYEIKTDDDICERFSVFRSMRRASATRALNEGVLQSDIDVINRWHAAEEAQGKKPSRPMRQHYAEVNLLIEPFLRYTGAM